MSYYSCAKGHVLVHPGDLCTVCDEEFYAGEQWTEKEIQAMVSVDAELLAKLQAKKAAAEEKVHHPAHYGGADNPYEVIKVLEAWLTPEQFRGFLKGNIVKYVARADKKGGREDHNKAEWYLTHLVDFNHRVPPMEHIDGAVTRQLQAVIKKHGLIRGKLQDFRAKWEAAAKDNTKFAPDPIETIDEILRIG
jgi:hypothetical protein